MCVCVPAEDQHSEWFGQTLLLPALHLRRGHGEHPSCLQRLSWHHPEDAPPAVRALVIGRRCHRIRLDRIASFPLPDRSGTMWTTDKWQCCHVISFSFSLLWCFFLLRFISLLIACTSETRVRCSRECDSLYACMCVTERVCMGVCVCSCEAPEDAVRIAFFWSLQGHSCFHSLTFFVPVSPSFEDFLFLLTASCGWTWTS